MIVWINGAFGSGKTSLVAELRRRLPEALVFDPETVGYLLRDIVDVPTGNFQDLPLWRSQVASIAIGLVEEYGQPLLVPMTLVNRQYVDEIFGAVAKAGIALEHVFLKVSPEVLARRIDARQVTPDDSVREAGIRSWCKAQIEPCIQAAGNLPEQTVFLDGEKPTAELADEVLVRIDTMLDRNRPSRDESSLPSA